MTAASLSARRHNYAVGTAQVTPCLACKGTSQDVLTSAHAAGIARLLPALHYALRPCCCGALRRARPHCENIGMLDRPKYPSSNAVRVGPQDVDCQGMCHQNLRCRHRKARVHLKMRTGDACVLMKQKQASADVIWG